MNLDITQEKANRLNNLEDKVIEVLTMAFEKGGEVDDKVKISLKVLNAIAKNRQTLTAREAVRWQIVSSISTEAERKRYVEVSSPFLIESTQRQTGKRAAARSA